MLRQTAVNGDSQKDLYQGRINRFTFMVLLGFQWWFLAKKEPRRRKQRRRHVGRRERHGFRGHPGVTGARPARHGPFWTLLKTLQITRDPLKTRKSDLY